MSNLFKVENVLVNGEPIAVEDGTVKVEGLAKFENEVVSTPLASQDDFQKRKAVACMIKGNIMFGENSSHVDFTSIQNADITLKDEYNNKRLLCHKCSIAKFGELGDGPVEVEFNVLGTVQWL